MSPVIYRCLAVTLVAGAFLGADIAFAEGAEEPVRVPVGISVEGEESEEVVVVKGDHLWKISERHLETRMKREPANSEIGPYWRDVIAENVDSLRSGDPDLIYPGEVIEMPATPLSEQP